MPATSSIHSPEPSSSSLRVDAPAFQPSNPPKTTLNDKKKHVKKDKQQQQQQQQQQQEKALDNVKRKPYPQKKPLNKDQPLIPLDGTSLYIQYILTGA